MNPIYKFCINRATVNLLDPTMVRQGLLSTSTGQVSTSTVYDTSDFIPVIPGTNYKLCEKSDFISYAPAAICFYTVDKIFISGQYALDEVPANAAYLRVSMQGLNDYGVFVSTVASWSDFVSPRVYPIYKADLAKEYNREQNEQFYRATLEGKLTFQRDDYVWILAQAFDFEYIITLYISYNAGYSWNEYWTGSFWKTDCDFDEDSQTVIVQPTVKDQYTDVLAGIDKEFNLIDLAPEMAMVKADKRPMIQVYIPGDSTVGCFLAGMSWEQECDIVTDEQALVNTYNFALSASLAVAEVVEDASVYFPEIPTIYTKRYAANNRFTPATPGTTDFVGTDYTVRYYFQLDGGGFVQRWQILRNSDSTVLWEWTASGSGTPVIQTLPFEVTLTPVSGSGASGNITLYVHDIPVYCRYVLDVDTIGSQNTSPIPDDDIVENNRNYRRAIGYEFPDCVFFSTNRSSTPTKWGLYQPGEYYQKPAAEPYYGEFFPVSRREWGKVSVWFTFFAFDQQLEEAGRKAYTIKNNYPLWSVISVLLNQIAPGITHEATTDYSQFLYGQNFVGITQTLLVTPKSNILTADYDQPAQKAPITLRKILDMLRDCFRLYWFIDDQNRFRIEHIVWFMRGGSYLPSEISIAHDLTEELVSRNNKPWAFVRNQYKFDKPAMAERYEFGWMDEVTYLFEGFPVDIKAKYVTPGNIQQIKVDQFTSDIDYMLLNPGACSKDGFALLAGIDKNELSASETYILHGNEYVPFREPVPDEWKGTDAKMRFTLSGGHTFFRVYLTDGTYNQYDFDAGTIETVIPIPTNARVFYLYGTEGQTVEFAFIGIGTFALPYVDWYEDGNAHCLQNAYVAFCFLQQYYAYDMPAYHYRINNTDMIAYSIKKLKTQNIRFPLLYDINLNQLIRTTLGDGTIDKLSINLSSRSANATLKYDTE